MRLEYLTRMNPVSDRSDRKHTGRPTVEAAPMNDKAARNAAASASEKHLLEMLINDLGHLKHRYLCLAENLSQFLVGIYHPLVDFVL